MRTYLRENGLWQYMDRSDGLPTGSALNSFIHRETGLWLVEQDTIHHLDGNRFVSYPVPFSEGQEYRGAFMTRDGRIWIHTEDEQLFCFDGHRCSQVKSPFPEEGHYHRVHPYGDSGMYLRLHKRMFIFDGKEVTTYRVDDGCPAEDGNSCEGADGAIWLLTSDEVYRFDGTSFEGFEWPKELPQNRWGGCVADLQSDNLWIESKDGPIHFDGESFSHDRLPYALAPSRGIAPKFVDSGGNLWCLSYPDLCVRREPDGTFERWSSIDGLATDYPRRILGEDAEGGMWFYFGPAGVCRHDRHSADILSPDHVSESIVRDDSGAIWWGHGNELVRYDNGETTVSQHVPYIVDLAPDNVGRIWISSYFGVSFMDPEENLFPVKWADKGIASRAVIAARDGSAWFGFTTDLVHYSNGETTHFTKEQTGIPSVSCISEQEDGSLLIGSGRGGGVRIFKGGESEPFAPLDDPRLSNALCITACPGNRYWVGTTRGFGYFNGAQLTFFGREQGVIGEVVQIFIDSSGSAWIATQGGGLVRSNGQHLQFLTQDDILLHSCVTGIVEEAEDTFVIATFDGVCRLRTKTESKPTVRIEKVVADREYVDPEAVEFAESVPRVRVAFGGTTLKSVPLQYIYKLEGHDDDWKQSVSPTIVYEGLPPGEYNLMVRSIDRDLVYSETTATLKLTVQADTRDTAIAELQHELKGARDFAANILRSMNDAIVVIDTDGKIRTINYGALNLLGYEEDDLIGAHASKLLPERHAYFMSDASLARIMDEGFMRHRERLYMSHDGVEIPVMFSASCICDSDGNIQGIVTVASDIREHKQMQGRLQSAQKMESLGVLAGGIAHDFNNLLVGVLGNADIIADELEDDSPLKEETGEIISAAQKAAKLCREMLAYAGKGAYVLEALDVSETVKHLGAMLKATIPKKVKLDLKLKQDLPSIRGDETQVSQVIMNLVTNAAEAIGGGEGTITIRTGSGSYDHTALESPFYTETPEPGDYVFLEISDDGCGIEEEVKETLFEPFTTTKFTGRGLGLAAVHGIVRSHKGTLQLDSTVGKGSIFTVYLPVTTEGNGSQVTAPDIHPVPGPTFSGTVLIADDEEGVLNLARRMLQRMGFTVLTAANGRECVEVFEQHKEDISFVLVDLTMPELDGAEAFKLIHEIDPAAQVIMTSGYTTEDVALRFDGGAEPLAFLQKPFQRRKLIAAIELALGSRDDV